MENRTNNDGDRRQLHYCDVSYGSTTASKKPLVLRPRRPRANSLLPLPPHLATTTTTKGGHGNNRNAPSCAFRHRETSSEKKKPPPPPLPQPQPQPQPRPTKKKHKKQRRPIDNENDHGTSRNSSRRTSQPSKAKAAVTAAVEVLKKRVATAAAAAASAAESSDRKRKRREEEEEDTEKENRQFELAKNEICRILTDAKMLVSQFVKDLKCLHRNLDHALFEEKYLFCIELRDDILEKQRNICSDMKELECRYDQRIQGCNLKRLYKSMKEAADDLMDFELALELSQQIDDVPLFGVYHPFVELFQGLTEERSFKIVYLQHKEYLKALEEEIAPPARNFDSSSSESNQDAIDGSDDEDASDTRSNVQREGNSEDAGGSLACGDRPDESASPNFNFASDTTKGRSPLDNRTSRISNVAHAQNYAAMQTDQSKTISYRSAGKPTKLSRSRLATNTFCEENGASITEAHTFHERRGTSPETWTSLKNAKNSLGVFGDDSELSNSIETQQPTSRLAFGGKGMNFAASHPNTRTASFHSARSERYNPRPSESDTDEFDFRDTETLPSKKNKSVSYSDNLEEIDGYLSNQEMEACGYNKNENVMVGKLKLKQGGDLVEYGLTEEQMSGNRNVALNDQPKSTPRGDGAFRSTSGSVDDSFAKASIAEHHSSPANNINHQTADGTRLGHANRRLLNRRQRQHQSRTGVMAPSAGNPLFAYSENENAGDEEFGFCLQNDAPLDDEQQQQQQQKRQQRKRRQQQQQQQVTPMTENGEFGESKSAKSAGGRFSVGNGGGDQEKKDTTMFETPGDGEDVTRAKLLHFCTPNKDRYDSVVSFLLGKNKRRRIENGFVGHETTLRLPWFDDSEFMVKDATGRTYKYSLPDDITIDRVVCQASMHFILRNDRRLKLYHERGPKGYVTFSCRQCAGAYVRVSAGNKEELHAKITDGCVCSPKCYEPVASGEEKTLEVSHLPKNIVTTIILREMIRSPPNGFTFDSLAEKLRDELKLAVSANWAKNRRNLWKGRSIPPGLHSSSTFQEVYQAVVTSKVEAKQLKKAELKKDDESSN